MSKNLYGRPNTLTATAPVRNAATTSQTCVFGPIRRRRTGGVRTPATVTSGRSPADSSPGDLPPREVLRIGTPLLPRFTSWSTSRISGSDSDSDYRSALVWLPRGLMALVVPAVPVVTAPAAPAPGGARTCVAEHPYAEHPTPAHPGPDSPHH